MILNAVTVSTWTSGTSQLAGCNCLVPLYFSCPNSAQDVSAPDPYFKTPLPATNVVNVGRHTSDACKHHRAQLSMPVLFRVPMLQQSNIYHTYL